MFRLKAELEDLAFFYLEPEAYKQIQEGLALKKGSGKSTSKRFASSSRTNWRSTAWKGKSAAG
jgi:(p)ppGpp synthase/HD superfamily hydrolase